VTLSSLMLFVVTIIDVFLLLASFFTYRRINQLQAEYVRISGRF